MKTVFVAKDGGLKSNSPWIVVENGYALQVEDDVEAPLGWLWDGDYRSTRPTFSEPE